MFNAWCLGTWGTLQALVFSLLGIQALVKRSSMGSFSSMLRCDQNAEQSFSVNSYLDMTNSTQNL